jgi:succinate dehydrogenase/fumarate reductase cytochrome b subunit
MGLAGCVQPDLIPMLMDFKANYPMLTTLFKGCIVFPLTYHSLGGFRALWQDKTAKGYSREFQDKSSYGIAALSALATIALSCANF